MGTCLYVSGKSTILINSSLHHRSQDHSLQCTVEQKLQREPRRQRKGCGKMFSSSRLYRWVNFRMFRNLAALFLFWPWLGRSSVHYGSHTSPLPNGIGLSNSLRLH
ncbi:uncharacterized protein SCHCODRAFT_02284949 [Schizophyllum commune H4-8]|uniref:uncharacterized protein n=1 Tax=Schizophyllum commune (strain H4-8 / FGSC 9210) TaxID=578458 RepID=UPI00215ECC3E|nr:uncharacterized protein SCHCODRAFT_02284949 [Schizophyllum commune H4-8]KAI5892154.1 hypothetical protein SCHCODRAFT_02284949 [Schizophyllum commune H4-8]